MKPLFIRLYLDEDVNVLLSHLLRARGFHVTTTHEAGQIGKSDEDQLAFATARRRVVLTHKTSDSHAQQGGL